MSSPVDDVYFIPVAYRRLGGIHHARLRIFFPSLFSNKKVLSS